MKINDCKTLLSEYRFGSEIEFTGIHQLEACALIKKALGSTFLCKNENDFKIEDNKGRVWEIGIDRTISPCDKSGDWPISSDWIQYSNELKTPILTLLDLNVFERVINTLRQGGAMVNKSCALHFHTDVDTHTPQTLKHLLYEFYKHQDLIYKMFEIYIEREAIYSPRLEDEIIEKLYNPRINTFDAIQLFTGYKMAGIFTADIRSQATRRTIEFRIFNSSLEWKDIESNLLFTLSLVDKSIRSSGLDYSKGFEPNEPMHYKDTVLKGNDKVFACKSVDDLKKTTAWLQTLSLNDRIISHLTEKMRSRLGTLNEEQQNTSIAI